MTTTWREAAQNGGSDEPDDIGEFELDTMSRLEAAVLEWAETRRILAESAIGAADHQLKRNRFAAAEAALAVAADEIEGA